MKTNSPPTALFFNYEVALQEHDKKAARHALRELKRAGFVVTLKKASPAKSKGGAR